MGVSPAPEVFQRKLTQALEDLLGLYIVVDDVLMTGQGGTHEMAQRDHDEKLRLIRLSNDFQFGEIPSIHVWTQSNYTK